MGLQKAENTCTGKLFVNNNSLFETMVLETIMTRTVPCIVMPYPLGHNATSLDHYCQSYRHHLKHIMTSTEVKLLKALDQPLHLLISPAIHILRASSSSHVKFP